MTRALLVMVLTLGSLLFSFRARATRRAVRGAPTAESGHVRGLATPVYDPTRRRGRALGTLVVACLVGGVGVGLTIVVALTTLTSGMSGLLR
jgi:hypothetical protein